MRTLLWAGLGLFLAGCNCGGTVDVDAGIIVDAGRDAGFDAGVDAGPTVDAGPSRVSYRITSVTGTYTGNGVNVVSATRTDTLPFSTCNYTGSADAGFLIGVDGGSPMVQVSGTAMCPVVTATADAGAPASCMAGPTTANAALFQGTVEMSGWSDSAIITFKIIAPPSLFPACNNATVVSAASQPWGIQGTATAYQFKSLVPFQVKLKGPEDGGTKTLMSGTNTSNVSWDFTMTIDPKLP